MSLVLAKYFRLLHGVVNTLKTRKILMYIQQCKLIGKGSDFFLVLTSVLLLMSIVKQGQDK